MAAIPPNTYLEGFKKSMCDGIDGAFKKGVKHGRYLALQEYTRLKEERGKDINVHSWISVDERLPEPFHSVLVHMPQETPCPTVHEGYRTNDGCWYSAHFVREFDEVTHWMPLPEPPKEDAKCTES